MIRTNERQEMEKALERVRRNISERDGCILIEDISGHSTQWLLAGLISGVGILFMAASSAELGLVELSKHSRNGLILGALIVAAGIVWGLLRSRFIWDAGAGRWRQEQGIGPLLIVKDEGDTAAVAGLSCGARTRVNKGEDLTPREDIWSVYLVFRDRQQPPWELPDLEMPWGTVDRDTAYAFAAEAADRMNLPMVTGTPPARHPRVPYTLEEEDDGETDDTRNR